MLTKSDFNFSKAESSCCIAFSLKPFINIKLALEFERLKENFFDLSERNLLSDFSFYIYKNTIIESITNLGLPEILHSNLLKDINIVSDKISNPQLCDMKKASLEKLISYHK